MTEEIRQQYQKLQLAIEMFGPALNVTTQLLDLEQFENAARPYANGTMGIIALQFMGVQDLKTTEKNLTKAIEISRTIRQLLSLINIPAPEAEQT